MPWQLTFHVKQDHVALANAPVESEAPEPNGMKRVTMAESKPLPSYLVAFVVGPFDVIDSGSMGQAKTPLRFVAPKGHAAELAYAREVTPRVVAALERYFEWTTRTASSMSRSCLGTGARWSTPASSPWASRSRSFRRASDARAQGRVHQHPRARTRPLLVRRSRDARVVGRYVAERDRSASGWTRSSPTRPSRRGSSSSAAPSGRPRR